MREIPYALAARSIQGGVMLVAVVIILQRLTPAEQGLLWSFLGLGALQHAGDIGLGQVVLQTASQRVSRGDAPGLAGFWRLAKRLAAVALPLAALLVGLAGLLLLSAADADAEVAGWRAPWVAFVLGTMATQALFLGVAYVEGGVSAAHAWRFQAWLEGASGAAFLAGLWSGAGLWSAALYAAARCAITAAWLAGRRPQFARGPASPYGLADWRREIWPYQWKVAVNALTGILIFRSLTPIVLAEQGAPAAGRFGLSLALMNTWLSFTVAWPLSQTARLGGAVARGESDDVGRIFRKMLFGSTALSVVGAVCGLGALSLLEPRLPALAAGYAGFAATALLLAAAVVHNVVFCIAVLLRSARSDPLLPFGIGGSLFTLVAVWLAAHLGALPEVAAVYFACTCVGLILVTIVFRGTLRRALG